MTAVQNIGLTVSPIIAGYTLKTKRDQGYFWYFIFFDILAIIGTVLNVWLYFDDINKRKGILNKVDKGETIEDLMTTPNLESRNKAKQMREELAQKGDESTRAALLNYKLDDEARANLKRSIGKNSMASTR